ncbi:MAG: EAL domain-containing protein, partial [Gammaproteobacteria bacterium]|nr:EAL domain-containing protein [Gammaproteobacteria bacterium]
EGPTTRMQPRHLQPAIAGLAAVGTSPAWAAGDAAPPAILAILVLLLLAAGAVLGLLWNRIARTRRAVGELAGAVEQLTQGNLAAGVGPDLAANLAEARLPEGEALAEALDRLRQGLRTTASARDYLNQVIASISDAVVLTRMDGTITRVNPAAERLLGLTGAELRGKPLADFVSDAQRAAFSLADTRTHARETSLHSATGTDVPVSYTCAELAAEDPALRGYVITARNISERKVAEQRIRYLARIDSLTKVPNRMQFQHLLQRAIARARRGDHRLALIYMDVDKFKEINDTFGHTAGDLCLETLTDRLRSILPDSSVVGRLAGDEFAVILDNLDPARNLRAEVVATTRLLQETIAEPVHYQGHQVYMTTSAGIALYPGDGNNVIDLIRNADAALYRAKRQGGAALEVYHADMNAAAVERLMLKSRLRKAFEKNELRVHYQPKVNLKDGTIAGAEALVRWELTDRGIVLPSEFIPLAEESNLILQIGEWVLDRVCADCRSWARIPLAPGRVSVNLSLRQLKQRDFIGRVQAIYARHDIQPNALELEITETTLMEDPKRTLRLLNDLHGLGLRLAIDDFGTGYSSLSALQQFPISTLKIDQSFVQNATRDHDQATIVALIIEMGHSLKLEVVAEGVESEEQLRFLRALNCDYAQGLLFGRAMAADDFRDLVLDQQGGPGRYRPLFARG